MKSNNQVHFLLWNGRTVSLSQVNFWEKLGFLRSVEKQRRLCCWQRRHRTRKRVFCTSVWESLVATPNPSLSLNYCCGCFWGLANFRARNATSTHLLFLFQENTRRRPARVSVLWCIQRKEGRQSAVQSSLCISIISLQYVPGGIKTWNCWLMG